MTYLEVLGAILILACMGSVVATGMSTSIRLDQMTRDMRESTRLAENMTEYLLAELDRTQVEELIKMVSLEQLIGSDCQADFQLTEYVYELQIWPVVVDGGVRWTGGELGEPLVRLGTGHSVLGEGRHMGINIPLAATYAFENDTYCGHFVGGPKPESSLGALKVEIEQLGDTMKYHTIIKEITGKVRIKEKYSLIDQHMTYWIEDVRGSHNQDQSVVLILDCSSLKEEVDRQLGLVTVINQSKAQLVVKPIGEQAQVGRLGVEVKSEEGPIAYGMQTKEVGHQTYLIKLKVATKKGKILKELMVFKTGIGEGGTVEEKE